VSVVASVFSEKHPSENSLGGSFSMMSCVFS